MTHALTLPQYCQAFDTAVHTQTGEWRCVTEFPFVVSLFPFWQADIEPDLAATLLLAQCGKGGYREEVTAQRAIEAQAARAERAEAEKERKRRRYLR